MPSRPPTYPHLHQIEHWPTQQSLRLLWDAVHDLRQQLSAQTTPTALEARLTSLESSLSQAQQTADEALITAGKPTTDTATTPTPTP